MSSGEQSYILLMNSLCCLSLAYVGFYLLQLKNSSQTDPQQSILTNAGKLKKNQSPQQRLVGTTQGTSISGIRWTRLAGSWPTFKCFLGSYGFSCTSSVLQSETFQRRELLTNPLVTSLSSSNDWLLPVYASPMFM